jgi:hypothetical protein
LVVVAEVVEVAVVGQAVALVVLVGQVEGEREDPGVMTTTRIARPARVRTVRVEDFKRRREQRPRRLPRRRLLHSTHQSAPAPQLSAKPASNYGRDTPGQVAICGRPRLDEELEAVARRAAADSEHLDAVFDRF